MSDIKNNHIVPRVYLNAFSCKEQTNCVYARTRTPWGWSKGTALMGTRSICVHRDAYSIIRQFSTDRRRLEQFFCSFEQDWVKVLSELRNIPFFTYRSPFQSRQDLLTPYAQGIIIKFIHFQYLRSLKILNKMRGQWSRLPKKKRRLVRKSLNIAYSQYAKAIFAQMSFTQLLDQSFTSDSGIIEKALGAKQWTFWINTSSTPFLTSDSPVLWLDEVHRDGIGSIVLPLTPIIAIEIRGNAPFRPHILLESLHDEQSVVTSNINRLVIENAFRQIISNCKDSLNFT